MSYKTDFKWLLDIKYNGHPSEAYNKDLLRLRDGEPLDYIIGHSDFLNSKITLENKPLIPRSETEYWVDKVLREFDKSKKLDVLDIFAGSGCIGVSVLNQCKNAEVTFAEIREDLEETILKNINVNLLQSSSYKVVISDVFEQVSGKYDYIFANPPYILKERKTVEDSVLEHEPHNALFAKDNGLEYVKKLIDEGYLYLKKGGKMFIEFDSWQKDLISKYANKNAKTYRKFEFIDDQHSIPRVIKLSL